MKIEKINDKQIRCILTSADFLSRQLKISELAFGTDKAKQLFRDMMEQANDEFGFNTENIPLMIEAMPLSPDSIALIITKVDGQEGMDASPKMPSPESPEAMPVLGIDEDLDDEKSPFVMVRIFAFRDFDVIIRAAHMMKGAYNGSNSLYKDVETQDYLLVVTREGTAEDFRRVCNMLSEYGIQNLALGTTLAFLEEHCDLLLSGNALQVLADF